MNVLPLPFETIGGRAPIARLVDRFYDIMESDPAYAELRAMHAADLGPMRESLTDFLVAWMGGPRDWFTKRPNACIMSDHVTLNGMTRDTARQWMDAMTRAMADVQPGDEALREGILSTMERMCSTMAMPAVLKPVE